MSKYSGNIPCAGCAKTGAEVPRKLKEELCDHCKRLICLGRELEQEYRPDQFYHVRATWFKLRFHNDENGGIEIEKAICALLDAMNRKIPDGYESLYLTQADALTGSHMATIRKDYAVPLKQLCEALKGQQERIHKLFKEIEMRREEIIRLERNKIFNEGVIYGRSLLVQLNNGEITLKDFEKTI